VEEAEAVPVAVDLAFLFPHLTTTMVTVMISTVVAPAESMDIECPQQS